MGGSDWPSHQECSLRLIDRLKQKNHANQGSAILAHNHANNHNNNCFPFSDVCTVYKRPSMAMVIWKLIPPPEGTFIAGQFCFKQMLISAVTDKP